MDVPTRAMFPCVGLSHTARFPATGYYGGFETGKYQIFRVFCVFRGYIFFWVAALLR